MTVPESNLTVEQLLGNDRWAIAELNNSECMGILRFRQPVLGPTGVERYDRLLVILWAYAEADSGALPDPQAMAEMERFEEHLSAAVERDAVAVLTAVLTLDGARQWVFYACDLKEFGRRLSTMPDYHGEPYPIELTSDEDPTWNYLRETILSSVSTEDAP